MKVWIDAQLPPLLAAHLRRSFGVEATHVYELGNVSASDAAIFAAARTANAIVVTKDSDFVRLLEANWPPPQVLWVTIGNARNSELWKAIESAWPQAVAHLEAGEPLVEVYRTG